MTLGELIQILEDLSDESPLGDDTVVYGCLPEVEPIEILRVDLEKDGDGAIVSIILDSALDI